MNRFLHENPEERAEPMRQLESGPDDFIPNLGMHPIQQSQVWPGVRSAPTVQGRTFGSSARHGQLEATTRCLMSRRFHKKSHRKKVRRAMAIQAARVRYLR